MTHKALMLSGLLLSSLAGCKSRPSGRELMDLYAHPGRQWLSWTTAEREYFVYGFVQGYGEGVNQACSAADKLFEKDVPHLFGYDHVASTFPSERCRATVEQYSNIKLSTSAGPDFSSYTNVITTFYTKHPEYRDIPVIELMEYLTDAKNNTADDLYLRAKAERWGIAPQ